MRVTLPTEWPRWAGTLSDVSRLAEGAQQLVQENGSTPKIMLSVQYQDGVQRVYDSVGEFERATGDQRLERVRSISVELADPADRVSVSISFTRLGGVSLVAAGTDETSVEGVSARLARTINEEAAWPQLNGALAASVVFPSAFVVLMVASMVATDWVIDVVPDVVLDNVLLGLIVTGLILGLPAAALALPIRYLAEPLELLPPGVPTRVHRLKGWLRHRRNWLVGAALTAVVGFVVRSLLA